MSRERGREREREKEKLSQIFLTSQDFFSTFECCTFYFFVRYTFCDADMTWKMWAFWQDPISPPHQWSSSKNTSHIFLLYFQPLQLIRENTEMANARKEKADEKEPFSSSLLGPSVRFPPSDILMQSRERGRDPQKCEQQEREKESGLGRVIAGFALS